MTFFFSSTAVHTASECPAFIRPLPKRKDDATLYYMLMSVGCILAETKVSGHERKSRNRTRTSGVHTKKQRHRRYDYLFQKPPGPHVTITSLVFPAGFVVHEGDTAS